MFDMGFGEKLIFLFHASQVVNRNFTVLHTFGVYTTAKIAPYLDMAFAQANLDICSFRAAGSLDR